VLPENLAYALTQVLHNFGAVTVLGGAALALWTSPAPPTRESSLAPLVGTGWAIQIASGAGFGGVSLYFYGQLPDIHGTATIALIVKIACAIAGLALAAVLWVRGPRWNEPQRKRAWWALGALAATALTAAAFLRWFA
jgi:hypothetical protein